MWTDVYDVYDYALMFGRLNSVEFFCITYFHFEILSSSFCFLLKFICFKTQICIFFQAQAFRPDLSWGRDIMTDRAEEPRYSEHYPITTFT